jgi:hypothetical protein
MSDLVVNPVEEVSVIFQQILVLSIFAHRLLHEFP